MEVVEHSALLPYSTEQIYQLVSDIESYPAFLPWCKSTQIHEKTEHQVTASIEVAKGGISQKLTTCNILKPFDSMDMQLVDGPFHRFSGLWTFQSLSACASKVTLHMEFEFNSKTMAFLLGPLFNQAANTLVDAFCQRAHQEALRCK